MLLLLSVAYGLWCRIRGLRKLGPGAGRTWDHVCLTFLRPLIQGS